jgi:uncharacterized protein YndB with AHSA1/START domain
MKKELKYAHIVQEHVIKAPRAKVYQALTEGANSWWSHRVNDDAEVRMDARLGGRFWEELKNGGGMQYARVRWLKPGEEIEFEGSMGFDGPATGVFSFTLEEKGGSTLVKLEHKFFGPLSDETEGMYTQGWTELLGTNLKEFIEQGKKVS